MKLYDISPPLNNQTPCWPGDTAYRFELTCSKRGGDTVNVGAVTMSVHTGAHIDAPFHFSDDLPAIDQIPLEVFIGPAIVLDVAAPDEIGVEALRSLASGCPARVLLRTSSWQ